MDRKTNKTIVFTSIRASALTITAGKPLLTLCSHSPSNIDKENSVLALREDVASMTK